MRLCGSFFLASRITKVQSALCDQHRDGNAQCQRNLRWRHAEAQTGAAAVSVTVNGLGERAGNAPLEEVAMALNVSTRFGSRIRCDRLSSLCEAVAGASRRPIPVDKPIVGPDIFSHESGIHCHALLKNAYAYQPFLPETLGRAEMKFVAGKHSGRAVIDHFAQNRTA